MKITMTKGIKNHWFFVLDQMRIMNEETLKGYILQTYPKGVI